MLRGWFSDLHKQWQERRIRVAHERYINLLATTPRYWQIGTVAAAGPGGAVWQVGRVTKRTATALALAHYGEILYVDLEGAFIAVRAIGKHVPASESDMPAISGP